MSHTILCLDFESYYDDEYSLRKMAPPNYILDPRFELIGCAAKEGFDGLSRWIDGPDFSDYISNFEPATTTTVCFNALFDNCILAWRYGFVPGRMLCTMRMAAALRGYMLPSVSLSAVGKSLGVGPKGNTIQNVKGMRRSEIMSNPDLWRAFQEYANNDNEMNAEILRLLWGEFPQVERRIMDKVIRCAVEPKFVINTKMLGEHLEDLAKDKVRMLRLAAGASEEDLDEEGLFGEDAQDELALNVFASTLRSNPKFEELLKAHGVDVEYKASVTDPTREIPAFAKTDAFMSDLLEHDDPIVQALATARLGLRSTIEQTRGERFQGIAQLPWEQLPCGKWGARSLPIPLRYSGAHTHRLSGDWKMNAQNLPSGRGKKVSKLRRALEAPAGHKVAAADLAQIECRINAGICGQHDLLELFRIGGDPYSRLASNIFGCIVDKTTMGGLCRFIGKNGELGLGFGCGDKKFYTMVVRTARGMGMDMKKLLEVWTPDLARRSVDTYRQTHGFIRMAWDRLDNILRSAWLGKSLPVRFGPCVIGHGYVGGPGGLRMYYGNPREVDGELYYDYSGKTHKIYGSKFLENIVQFLARIVVMNAGLRIADRTGINFSLQEHDALVWIVPEAQEAAFKVMVVEEMRRPPSWMPTIPLDCEYKSGANFGECK